MLSRRDLLVASGVLAVRPPALLAQEEARPEIDWVGEVEGETLYSESVYLDMVSADGTSGFIARIGRYPTLGASWLWAHAFDPTGLYAFTTEQGTASETRTDLAASPTTYHERASEADLLLRRRGPRTTPLGFDAELSFPAHPVDRSVTAAEGGHPPHGSGPVRVAIAARVDPELPAGSSLPGRSEVQVTGSAEMSIGASVTRLDARGHFHEQVRETPRFVTPFVYATLRGPGFYSVAIKTETGATGFVLTEEANAIASYEVASFEIEGPSSRASDERRARLGLVVPSEKDPSAAQSSCEIVVAERHLYSVPIYGHRRRGTTVSGTVTTAVGTIQVSGCINDFLGHRLPYGLAD